MKNAVVTGAGGFIGKVLCKMLCNEGIKVYAIIRQDFLENDIAIKKGILIPIKCDLNNIEDLGKLITEKVDVFYHLAWAGVSGKERGDYKTQIKNIEWLMKAVEAAHTIQCDRFVGVGSTAETDVYNYSTLDGSTPNLVSLYGVAKISSRLMSKALCNSIGMEHLWATLANTYGESDNSNNFINFAYNLISSNQPANFTSGEQLYDFVYIDDIARGLICIGKNGVKNCNYYIGSGHPQKLKDFIIKIRDVVNPSKELVLGAIPFNGSSATLEQFDCNKLVIDTGYSPKISFEEGIRRLHESRSKGR